MTARQTHPIYGYSDYREYLKRSFETPTEGNETGRGTRRQVALYLNCQPSFISQVLNGKNDLSLEHAFRLNQYLNHGPSESQYFMLQVQLGKAGSHELRAFFSEQLEKLRRENLQVTAVVKKIELTEANIMRYFSDWNHIAIHLLVSMKQFQTREKLKAHLRMTEEQLSSSLSFLEAAHLIKITRNLIETGDAHIHIKKTSPYAFFVNQQLRLHILKKFNPQNDHALHFGTHFTISKQNLTRVRQKLLDFIGELNKEIEDSDPDTLCTIVLDMIEHQ